MASRFDVVWDNHPLWPEFQEARSHLFGWEFEDDNGIYIFTKKKEVDHGQTYIR